MNSRRAPTDIRRLHLPDEFTDLCINGWSTRAPAPTLKCPVSPKAPSMPAYNGVGMQDVQHNPPPVNHFREQDPQEVKVALANRQLALDRSLLKSEEAASAGSNFSVADLQQGDISQLGGTLNQCLQ